MAETEGWEVIYVTAYIGAIVFVNWAFSVAPMITLPGGGAFPPVALLVGFVFVLRDMAQRAIGHIVLWAMLAGVALSYVLADPYVALASALAFAVSEFIDWGIYSTTNRPLSDRILWSSTASTPADTAIFLGLIGSFSLLAFFAMASSKMLGAVVVYVALRRRSA